MILLEFCIINKEISSTVDESTLYITGIANSGTEDLVGDTVTQQALQQICDAATNHNLHLDHDTMLEGIIGTITEANLVEDGVEIKARILDEKRDQIESLLKQGIKLGLSIAGVTKCNDENPSLIDEWILTEISLTPIPCDQATMGTVEIAKSFKQVINSITGLNKTKIETNKQGTLEEEKEEPQKEDKPKEDGGENMAEENTMTQDAVIELINTAFAEKQEELLESIRTELKDEYEAKFNAQEERISALESQIEALKEEPSEEKPEEKPEDKETPEEEKPEDEEGDIEKTVTGIIAKMFGVTEVTEPSFQYESKQGEEETKKGYTPRELAEIMAKQ